MKKAMAVTAIVILILAVIAGIALLMYGKKGAEQTTCLAEVNMCKQSFVFYKTLKESVGSITPKVDCIAVSPPNCEQRELKTEDKQQTMYIIAENLRHCWEKTLGSQNTMGEDFASVWFAPKVKGVKDVDFCLVCSEFVPNVDITSAEWDHFLDTRNVPNTQTPYSALIKPSSDQLVWTTKAYSYRGIGFSKGIKYYVVSVSAEESKGDGQVFIYISPDIDCGTTENQQVHYQLK